MPNSDELITVAAAAEELHLSPRTILHRIKAGTLAATKLGAGKTSAYVLTRAEVERAKAEQKATA